MDNKLLFALGIGVLFIALVLGLGLKIYQRDREARSSLDQNLAPLPSEDSPSEEGLKKYLEVEVPHYLGEKYSSLEFVRDYEFKVREKDAEKVTVTARVYRIILTSGKETYAGWGGVNGFFAYNVQDLESPELFAKHIAYARMFNLEPRFPELKGMTRLLAEQISIPDDWRVGEDMFLKEFAKNMPSTTPEKVESMFHLVPNK